ncbi:hypothetical protein AU255_03805 [Methyloprofundus sedimenti]|uniref:Sulfotransferase domain-containing protein n=1 Tax=Methyloprofundus sedimenti TaxID=1420851 RepID=A0A1V8M6L7_9GAMM|nr:sulfotransferase domain-containing protein [Methyloprofundus sedimenti]OQK17033.1 hypothetical protein AU255_03805 [Methyloprofundus sedimenti]
MNLPSVFIIGAAKSATTTLAELLSMHPRICLGEQKEPEFFSHDDHFSLGFKHYSENYKYASKEDIIIDASTSYSRSPQFPLSAQRIYHFNPQAKIIYVLRNPIDRSYSHYVHRYSKELYPNQPFNISFSEFVKQEPVCLDSSLYQYQLACYLKYFDSDSIHIVFTEDIKENQFKCLENVCSFIGVEYQPEWFKVTSSNVGQSFLDSRKKVAISNIFRSLPFYHKLRGNISKPLKEKIYKLLLMSFAKSIDQDFTPNPLIREDVLMMKVLFKDSNDWLEKYTGRTLEHWDCYGKESE